MHAEICNQLSHAAFLGFAKLHTGASIPEFRLLNDLELIKKFFHYLEVRCIYTYIFACILIYALHMQNERQSSSGNQFAYCLSFLRAMRYLKSDSDTVKTVQQ